MKPSPYKTLWYKEKSLWCKLFSLIFCSSQSALMLLFSALFHILKIFNKKQRVNTRSNGATELEQLKALTGNLSSRNDDFKLDDRFNAYKTCMHASRQAGKQAVKLLN
ncbi:hypothetical protein GQX74_001337, partial [Glossina fuscipes]